MRPSFNPRLINGAFDDPGLYIPFLFQNRALIFDLGDITNLSSRDLLKISHGFVTHTHMDHFIGFDRLLRKALGREKTLVLFGPEGFIKNVEGKLSFYLIFASFHFFSSDEAPWQMLMNYTFTALSKNLLPDIEEKSSVLRHG